jgi:hypothetical protein
MDLEAVQIIGETRENEPEDYVGVNLTVVSSEFFFCGETDFDHSHHGGAIDAVRCRVTMVDSVFDTCTSDVGGGASFTDSAVFLVRTNFTAGSAVDEAGAFFCHGGTIKVTDGFISLNQALDVGAVSFNDAAGAVKGVIFILNVAHQSEAGGVMVRDQPVNFEVGAFIHNHAEAGWAGALTIYNIVGNITFDRTQFVSNEVLGWHDTHVYVYGPETTVVFAGCTFNNPNPAEAVMVEQVDGHKPVLDMSGSQFGVKIAHVYEELMANESAEFLLSFGTTWSGGFALVMIVVGPVFMAIVTAILTC